MRGLTAIPNSAQLSQAYLQLEKEVPIADLVKFSQWSRLDPRLAELLVGNLSRHWQVYSPIEIHRQLHGVPWPSAFCALALFVRVESGQRLFRKWLNCLADGILPAPGEQFYIGTTAFGGDLQRRNVSLSLFPFRRWGYFETAAPFGKALAQSSSWMRKPERMKILERMALGGKPVAVNSYLAELGFAVSRRVAEMDLQNSKLYKAQGFTQNRRYLPLAKIGRK